MRLFFPIYSVYEYLENVGCKNCSLGCRSIGSCCQSQSWLDQTGLQIWLNFVNFNGKSYWLWFFGKSRHDHVVVYYYPIHLSKLNLHYHLLLPQWRLSMKLYNRLLWDIFHQMKWISFPWSMLCILPRFQTLAWFHFLLSVMNLPHSLFLKL